VKFWNKDKDLREKTWTKINSPFIFWPLLRLDGVTMTENEAKRMCQLMRSEGKFYFNIQYWYFQRATDATMFLLKLK
jgi:hypothetical protein